jgi:hypothetical protein
VRAGRERRNGQAPGHDSADSTWTSPVFCTRNAPAIVPATAGAVVLDTLGVGLVWSCDEDAFSVWGWGRPCTETGRGAGSAAAAQGAVGWWCQPGSTSRARLRTISPAASNAVPGFQAVARDVTSATRPAPSGTIVRRWRHSAESRT